MILIIGLGNPGQKFQKTRHNLGFQIIDEFRKKYKERYFFSGFNYIKKIQTLISEGKFNGKKIILVKPQTFMNLSGKSLKSIFNNYYQNWFQVQTTTGNLRQLENLYVIHDDIDLPLGKIKISIGRGDGGHKGVRSIIKELKTKNFVRFRVGIQPKTGKPKNIEQFVLQKFNKNEEKIIKETIKKTAETIENNLGLIV